MHDPKKAETLAKQIDLMIQKELGYRAAFVLTYSEPDFQEYHWITNVAREVGIEIARHTAKQMQGEIN